MKVLINLLPIKKGGGQQVAFNFVTQLNKLTEINPFFVVTAGTNIHNKLLDLKASNVFAVEDSLLARLKFQSLYLKKYVNEKEIDLIYTMFGPGLHCKGVKSITGCAYSNLFFPEINFWKGYSFLQKIKLKLIDQYRLSRTLKSDAIVFENAAMQRRATELFGYPADQTTLILPSISEHPENKQRDLDFEKRIEKIDKNKFNILMLTGWHKNKNIEQVPYILSKLKERGIEDVNFVITVSENHPDSQKLISEARKLSVENEIILFDSVKPTEVPSLFVDIDAVMLLSLLESFSNNIIESWYFKKPLFISDEEWSRAICQDAAVYVKRDDPTKIADAITKYRSNKKMQMNLEQEAKDIFCKYPNPTEKILQQVQLLKNVYYGKDN